MAKLLIVEDEKIILEMYKKAFQDSGFDVVVAENGIEGLTKAFEQHPNLILLDIQMPKMNGIEMLKKLRLDPWGKSVPVVMLTNMDGSADISNSLNLKIHRYIIKSLMKPKDIVKEIKFIFSEIQT